MPVWYSNGIFLMKKHEDKALSILSSYDATYVALADDLKTQVITADKRLFNATKKLGLIKWIGEF